MLGFRKKKSIITKIFTHPAFVSLIGFLVLLLVSLPLAKNISKKYRINKDIENLQDEISRLQKENLEVEKLIDYLESDEFLEEKARLNFGLKKEGENVVIIKDKQEDAVDDILSEAGEVENLTNVQKWVNYFFK